MQSIISINICSTLKTGLVMLVLLLIAGCSTEKEFVLKIDGPVTLECEGEEAQILELSSPLHDSLVYWFSNNRSGWDESPASYVPRITLIGADFTIHVLEDIIVVNSGSSQYVKNIARDSFYHKLCTQKEQP